MTLNDIQRGKANAPRRTVLYGLPGIGKTTFGAMSERPVFVELKMRGGHRMRPFPLARGTPS